MRFASRSFSVWVVAFVALVVSLGGCSGDATCVVGSTQACLCVGGLSGVQSCVAGGTYGACECVGSDAGSDAGLDAGDAGFVDEDGGGVDASGVDAGDAGSIGVDAGPMVDGGAGPRPYVRQLSLGMEFSCALLWSGVVRCWGGNTWGQLGDGTTTEALTPTTVGVITDAEQISVNGGGAAYACAVRSDRSVWCWGANGLGMLGFPDISAMPMETTPVAVPSLPSNVVQVASGWLTACARHSDDSVRCWGYNGDGELGDGTTMPRSGPVLAGVRRALGLTAGYNVVCAWLSGYAQCWGSNADGILGIGDGSTAPAVMGLTDATQLSVNEQTACALRAGGTVSCWGRNHRGQLGDGTTTGRNAPVDAVGLTDAIAVTTGWSSNCALRTGGAISCWGGNDLGEFGNGANIPSLVPVAVPGIPGAAVLAMGERHVCAANDVGVWCWGANNHGQLGDGTTVTSNTPVRVIGL